MSDNRRGKCYSCLHCEGMGKKYIEVRYRMVAHVYKHHLALDKAPFYCTLCLLRCTTKSALLNHVSKYSRHRQAVTELGEVDSQRFLVVNPSPAILSEGRDFRELSTDEMARLLPTSAEDGFNSEGPFTAKPATTEQADSNNGLISVQLTPEMLAQLINNKSSPSLQTTSAVLREQSFVPYSPAPSFTLPAYTPTSVPRTITPVQQPVQSPLCSQPPVKKQKVDTVTLPQPKLMTPRLMTPPLVPSTSATTAGPPSAASSAMNTPLVGNTSFLESLVAELDYDFEDEIELEEGAEPVKAKDTSSKIDQSVQTEAAESDEEDKPQNSLGESLEKCFKKMVEAFEQNSRAIRGIDKTLGALTDVVSRMNRSLERMGEEQRREHERLREEARERNTGRREEKRSEKEKKSEKDKENKPLKSVVNKK